MSDKEYRRIIDSTVKMKARDKVSVDVFLSDNGNPIYFLTAISKLPERRIIKSRVEAFWINGSGPPKIILKDMHELTGIEARKGYIEKIREALRHQDNMETLIDALVENGRMLLQIGTLNPNRVDKMDISDPKILRTLDLTYWPELEDGCLPYTEGIEDQFDSMGIRSSCRHDIYAPRPGQIYRFHRNKIMECKLSERGHSLHAYLSDDIHEFEIQIKVSPDGRKLDAIQSRSIRSPYPGICSLPFPRVSELAGKYLDLEFKKWVIDAVGGKKGCVHLKDLIMDIIRYYKQISK
jgi:hypothetical protein